MPPLKRRAVSSRRSRPRTSTRKGTVARKTGPIDLPRGPYSSVCRVPSIDICQSVSKKDPNPDTLRSSLPVKNGSPVSRKERQIQKSEGRTGSPNLSTSKMTSLTLILPERDSFQQIPPIRRAAVRKLACLIPAATPRNAPETTSHFRCDSSGGAKNQRLK